MSRDLCIHFDPGARTHTLGAHDRKRSGHWEKAEDPPRETLHEAGEYVFSPEIRCWVRRKPLIPPVTPPKRRAMPQHDGSGVFWEVCEFNHRTKQWGQPIWRVEAATMDLAIQEKTRLCLSRGWRPGWGRVRPC